VAPASVQAHDSCLHLVTGGGREALRDCLSQAAPGDSLLFLDAGVLHCLRPEFRLPEALEGATWFSSADLDARGLGAVARSAGLRAASDACFAQLLRGHRHCLTWK
jgi:sulfur transfer complex TusBCD TusB component (DsrH family)